MKKEEGQVGGRRLLFLLLFLIRPFFFGALPLHTVLDSIPPWKRKETKKTPPGNCLLDDTLLIRRGLWIFYIYMVVLGMSTCTIYEFYGHKTSFNSIPKWSDLTTSLSKPLSRSGFCIIVSGALGWRHSLFPLLPPAVQICLRPYL